MKKTITIFLIILITIFSCKKKDPGINLEELKIISLTPSITKILFNLEMDSFIVGVTDFCKFNGKVEKLVEEGKIKRIAGFNSFNFEKITALSATHIFGMDSVSMENKLMLEKLVSKEKTNWFYHPRNFEGIKEQITEIAKLVNKEKVANNIIKNMNKRLYNIQKSIDKIDVNERPSILVEIYFPPFTTAGINTFITDIIIKAGAKPALELKEDWPTISMEDIISAEPDIILRTHLTGKNKNLELLTAYKKNRVFTPSNIDIFLQPGVESIDAIHELYEYLYEASLIQTNNN